MANRWIANGSSYITAATLGNILTKKIRVVSQDTDLQTAQGYWFSQGGITLANREFGISWDSAELALYIGGTETVILSGAPLVIPKGELDFECDLVTGAYTLKNNGITIASGTGTVGANRVDGILFRLGARGATDTSATDGGYIASSGTRIGDTEVYIDDVLDRTYTMPLTGTNVPDSTNSLDGTLQAGTGGGSDWEAVPFAIDSAPTTYREGEQFSITVSNPATVPDLTNTEIYFK